MVVSIHECACQQPAQISSLKAATYTTYNAANELLHEVAPGGETAPQPTMRVDGMDEVGVVDGDLRVPCP